jgi:glycosyltransferase involved in cell wall biosynthesis
MADRPSLVVLTPVRNEGWILERFLQVTSRVADHIILADQGSTDDSRAIAARFENVTVIDNPDPGYSEATRQQLLLDAARRMVPGPRVLLAIDADEIIAADGPNSVGWRTMMSAAPGTVLEFERIDLHYHTDRCLRHDEWRPFGYVDDGAEHQGRWIHSMRIPFPPARPRVRLNSVRLLHYAGVRPTGFAARLRWYSVLENTMGTCPHVFKRRLRYHNHLDPTGDARVEPARPEWFQGWEDVGIDMHSISDAPFHWYDVEVLRTFGEKGTGRYWLDDVWRFDWEACRQWAVAQGLSGIPDRPIKPAPDWLVFLMRTLGWVHRHQVWFRQRLSGRRSRRFA